MARSRSSTPVASDRLDENTPLLRRNIASEEAVTDDVEAQGYHESSGNSRRLHRRHSSIQGSQGTFLAPDAGDLQSITSRSSEGEQDDGISSKSSPYYDGVSRKVFWVIMAGILSQYFMATFDSTLMASSHPVITSYFNASNAASWLSTAFLLTSTSFQPMFGRMSDTFGRKPLYILSLSIFAATTAWCALAQSISSFILARAFAGLGAGGVMSMVSVGQFWSRVHTAAS